MEQYLNVRDLAKLAGYGIRRAQKVVASGKIKAVIEISSNNRPCYKIPVTALPDDLQAKYYKQIGVTEELKAVIQNKPAPSPPKNLNYEELTAEQRCEVAAWQRILADWDKFVTEYNGSKTEANSEFIRLNADRYPFKISLSILYRKRKTLKGGNIADLVDGRGLKRKGQSCINNNLWQAFLYYYLDQSKHPVQACYDYTRIWAESYHPELLPLPSLSTFYRHIDSNIADPVETYAREGEKAYKDKYGFYIEREYLNMDSNEYWIADNHTFDVMVSGMNGKPKRLYLTAFMDARSGIFTGVYITDSPSGQATIYALRRGIQKYGIPQNIYVDNGREFLVHDVGGLGHRAKKSKENEMLPPPIFERLGINMTNALVRNARAKTIERRFLDVKNRLSRLFDSYTGGTVLEKPERLKRVLKDGGIIDEVEFTHVVEEMLEYNFNYQAYVGAVASDKGKLRIDVYNKHLKEKRVASEEDLWLMMLRTTRPQQVGRRGVHVTVAGQKIRFSNDELHMNWQGKKVYVRYDPENLSTVRVYDLEDRFITTAECLDSTILAYGASKEQVSSAVKEVNRHTKLVRDSVKSSRIVDLGAVSAFDIVLLEIEHNKQLPIAKSNAVISIHKADERLYETLPQAVGAEDIVPIDMDRMIRNIEQRKED